LRGARGALLKRPAAGVCSECNLPRRRRERRETTFQSWLSGPITNDVPALPLTKSARPVGDTEKVAQEWLRGASGFERWAILPYQRATVSPQYWPFPASPGHRAANQKDREFVASSFGSPNRTRTYDLLVDGGETQEKRSLQAHKSKKARRGRSRAGEVGATHAIG